MARYDSNFGAKRMERRRFQIFMLVTVPLLVALGYLVIANPPELSRAPSGESKVTFAAAVREVWGAIRATYSLDLEENRRPVPSRLEP